MTDPLEGPIHLHYLACGGAAGILGTPTSDEVEVTGLQGTRGRHRHFRGTVYGIQYGIPVHMEAGKAPASCHRPDQSGTSVESTVAWSAETDAHSVHGEIRTLWLRLGAESGRLGYPVSDEMPTPDGIGRRSRFQGGEIWWHPRTGASVRGAD